MKRVLCLASELATNHVCHLQDQDLLKSCGLWVKEVEGDGACLFRALLVLAPVKNGVTCCGYVGLLQILGPRFADQLVTDEPDAYAARLPPSGPSRR